MTSCYCCLCSILFIILGLVLGLGSDVIFNYIYVVELPQGTCNFENASFIPFSTLGLGYVNVYNVSFSGLNNGTNMSQSTMNTIVTVKYGPPPSWYLKTATNCQLWIKSMNKNILSCYYDNVYNVAFTESVSIIGWCIAMGIFGSLLILALTLIFTLRFSTEQKKYPPSPES